MKNISKTLVLSLLFVTTSALVACNKKVEFQTPPPNTYSLHSSQSTGNERSPQNVETNLVEQDYFIDNNLGIKFAYNSWEDKGTIYVKDNSIVQHSPNTENYYYIAVYKKNPTQTIESAILDLIKAKGKDAKNCKVINKGEYWAKPDYSEYIIELVDPKISYSQEELEKIDIADADAKKDGGPFNGEWEKREIYNKKLVEKCSDYADPLGLGTSKSTGSRFIYNGKNTFVFLPGSADEEFYREDTLEIF